MDWINKLNEKQYEAVINTEGYVRVIAGAGSGKTKLLVSRYAYIVENYGIDPKNILCVTFTNKAASEMKKRIRSIIGDAYDTTLICTYHGFCARMLREDPEKLFFTKNFQILDTSQQRSFLGEIYQKYELKLDHASFGKILKEISAYKSLHPNYVTKLCNPERSRILESITDINGKIIEEYLQKQKAVYALDFDDLLNFAVFLLQTDEEIRNKWQSRLNYIQVDEFQDSSKREMLLVDILSQKYKNLMIVGDPDQNIYEWRGSDVDLLLDFDKNHVPTKTIFLNRNYRSTPQILKCANTIIEHNKMRLKKDLYTLSENGVEVIHFHSKNEDAEMKILVDNIKQLHKTEKYKYSGIAVLYRSSFLSRLIEKKFVENNIPYEIYGGVKFYQRMEVLDIIAYLRHIAFDDDISFKRIVNKPRRKFGRVKMAALEDLQEENYFEKGIDKKESLYGVLKEHISDKCFKGSQVASLIELTERMRSEKGKMKITEIVNTVCSDSGYEEYIRELGDEERLDNLMEFKRIADEFEKTFGEDLTLEEFLQQISLQSGESEESSKDTVKLMTIHAAKGLEFPVVFIMGFTESIFPSSKTIENRGEAGLEEERRLCYVAITRAMERLFLMDSEGYSQSGAKKLPSRFLDEIGIENYNRIGVVSDELEHEKRQHISKNSIKALRAPLKTAGDEVEHHIFGKGKIISVDDKDSSYLIQFDSFEQPRNIVCNYFTEDFQNKLKKKIEKRQTETDGITEKKNKTAPLKQEFEKTDNNDKNDDLLRDFTVEETVNVPVIKSAKENVKESYVNNDADAPTESSLKKQLKDSENLWKRDDVPKSGWVCQGVTDLGAPVGICQMCGYQVIRYVHHMYHENYGYLDAGCICAGKMEGNIDAAKQREREIKNKAQRRESFQKRRWKISRNGNSYVKYKNHIVVLYQRKSDGIWKYSIDNVFCVEIFESRDEAKDAAFEALEKIISGAK